MQVTPKLEYQPLLNIGLHKMSLEEIEKMCVSQFPNSSTRQQIMEGLKVVVKRLEKANVVAELWVDGSFLTHKNDPADSDVVLRVDVGIYENGTAEQREAIDWITSNLKKDHLCDSYIFFSYPSEDKRAVLNDYMNAYWLKQFGFSRGENLKGIAVLPIGIN